jgi:TPR repeat protein
MAAWVESHPDDGESMYWLAFAYSRPDIFPDKTMERRRELIRKACAQDFALALVDEAMDRLAGPAGPRDRQGGLEYLKRALNRNEPEAFRAMGMLLLQGQGGMERDVAGAEKYLVKAVELGDNRASCVLGLAYASQGRATDALDMVTRGADAGDVQAQAILGEWYRSGTNVPMDHKKAFYWTEKAAAREYTDAEVRLADMLKDGEGCTPNLAEAYKWYQAAAEDGDKRARFAVAWAKLTGLGVQMDIPAGRHSLEQLAQEGVADAQVRLGKAYLEGIWGLRRDEEKARELFSKAAAGGDPEGALYVKWLEPEK